MRWEEGLNTLILLEEEAGSFMGYNNKSNMGEPEVGARVTCPFCGSTDTELFSLFGQQLLTVQYYCNSCHTPFERIKDDDVLDDYAARKENRP